MQALERRSNCEKSISESDFEQLPHAEVYGALKIFTNNSRYSQIR